ncbi:unnamed protein product [Urochloa decumbens]|uniref:Uncharacterized protein n=1 Tax=Urochloa decumbens TaxID=240449 RepID=A0ABC8XAD7_9POAL
MSLGTQPRATSFSFQVYSLCQKDVTFLPDEDPIPEQGPMYPLPFEAPRWMGPVAPGRSAASSSSHGMGGNAAAGGSVGDNGAVDEVDGAVDDIQKEEVRVAEVDEGNQVVAAPLNPMSVITPVPFGPAPPPADTSALVVAKVTLSLFMPAPRSISSYSFKFMTYLEADHSIKIPKYFDDPDMLLHLGKVLCDLPEEQVPSLLGDGRPDEPADVELEILDAPPPRTTPRKRRRKMMREPLAVDFVRRSARLNKEVDGFKDGVSAEAAAAEAQDRAIVPYEGKALSLDHTAPHLSFANVQGIAVNFLQIQPGAVDASILEVSDDE